MAIVTPPSFQQPGVTQQKTLMQRIQEKLGTAAGVNGGMPGVAADPGNWRDVAAQRTTEKKQEWRTLAAERTQAKQLEIEQPVQAQPAEEDKGFLKGVGDFFSGEDRQTPAIEGMEEFDMPFEFKARQAKTALGLLTSFDPKRQVSVLKENYPDLQFEQDDKGNIIVDGSAYGAERGVLNMPGISGRDLLQAGFQVAAFTPAGKVAGAVATLPAKAAAVGTASGVTQAAQDIAAQTAGATEDVSLTNVDVGDVALATLGGAGAELLFGAFTRAFPRMTRAIQSSGDVDVDVSSVTDDMRAAFKTVASDEGIDPGAVTDDLIRDYVKMARQSVRPKEMPATRQVKQAEALTEEFGVPFTKGQQTGRAADLNLEDSLRQGGLTDTGQAVIKRFDEQQARTIGKAQQQIQGRIAGGGAPQVETVNQAIDLSTGAIKEKAAAADQAIQEAYQAASGKVAALRYGDVSDLTRTIKESLSDRAVDFGESSLTPATKQAVKSIDEFLNRSARKSGFPTGGKAAKGATYPYGKLPEAAPQRINPLTLEVIETAAEKRIAKPPTGKAPSLEPAGTMAALTGKKDFAADIRNIEFTRRKLNQYIDAAANPTDRANVLTMKRSLDGWVDDAIDKALFVGDDDAVQLLKEARSMRADYARKFQQMPTKTKTGTKIQDEAGKVMERIVESNPTNEEISNYLFGSAKLAKNSSQRIAKRFKTVLGEDSPEWGSIREAAFLKLTGLETGPGKVLSGAKFAKKLDDAISGSGESFMKELFSKDEISQLKRFSDAVRRAQPDIVNPSKTAYKTSQLVRQYAGGLASKFGLMTGDIGTAAAIKVGEKGAEALGKRAATKAAMKAVAPTVTRPLIDINPAVISGATAATVAGGN